MGLSIVKRSKLIGLSLILTLHLTASNTGSRKAPSYDREEVEKRVKEMDDLILKPKFTKEVEAYIRGYTIRNRPAAERVLGRQVLYFPVFEKKLREQNLPESLKYLAVVESALVPDIVSRAKAVGLWQFMDDTGKEYGLKINRYIDERCDVIKSTDAALRYLTFLHSKYNDWALAMAAYNSGAGRVSRAIKRARSKNFWRIKRYLPRETRNYIPAFIAASYMLRNYEYHELIPQYPDLDLQITETIPIYDSFTFHQIAQLTGIPLNIIERLNPAYRKGFIPSNGKGNYLTLPQRVMPALKDFLEAKRPDNLYHSVEASPILVERPSINANSHYFKAIYIVQEDQSVYTLSKILKCSVHQLIAWNKLKHTHLKRGQELTIYLPKEIKRLRSYREMIKIDPFDPVPTLKFAEPFDRDPSYNGEEIDYEQVFRERYVYYEARKKEKLVRVARKLHGISLDDLVLLNELPANYVVKPGTKIKIKKYY